MAAGRSGVGSLVYLSTRPGGNASVNERAFGKEVSQPAARSLTVASLPENPDVLGQKLADTRQNLTVLKPVHLFNWCLDLDVRIIDVAFDGLAF